MVLLRSTARRFIAALSLLPGLAASDALAHEVPAQVGIRAIVVPGPARVRVLVQLPMDAVRDVEWPRRPGGMLDVARAEPFLQDAARLWLAGGLRLRDGARELSAPEVVAVRAALPSDRAFSSLETAASAIATVPLPDSVAIDPLQLRLEAILEVPLDAPVRDLVIDPQWAHLGRRTTTVLQLVLPDGDRMYSWDGDPGAVRLDPRWWHAAGRFMRVGGEHLLGGLDHLLFLLLLVLPVRALRPLIGIVSAFTVAHSITLVAAALGYAPQGLWFPPLVEVLIAASIVYTACENLLGMGYAHRWRLAFAFGLVHGFGFSAALGSDLQFAGRHLVTSLLAFNVGLEIAQVALLLAAVPLLSRVLGHLIPERPGVLLISAFVAHTAWHWMSDRWTLFRTFPLTAPAFDAALMTELLPLLILGGIAIGAMWLLAPWLTRLGASRVAGVLAVLLVGAAPLRSAAAQTAPRSTMAGVYTVVQANKGKNVFFSNCLGCHTVASHTGPAFQLKWFGRPLNDLYEFLSGAMPKTSPGSLSEDEYVWVTAYILRLNGMPPGKLELSADPAWLKAIRVDSTARAVPSSPHPSP